MGFASCSTYFLYFFMCLWFWENILFLLLSVSTFKAQKSCKTNEQSNQEFAAYEINQVHTEIKYWWKLFHTRNINTYVVWKFSYKILRKINIRIKTNGVFVEH